MAESPVEDGAALAWRLLATLEGGSLVLATTALLAFSARSKLRRLRRSNRRAVKKVLLTNTTSELGKELKNKFEALGCTVSTEIEIVRSGEVAVADKVDALVIVGATRTSGLEGLASLVSEDVYDNLKILDNLSPLVRHGGYIAWAGAGATSGTFQSAAEAFDSALRASIRHAARTCGCEAIWVGRYEEAERAADHVVAALMTCTTGQQTGFSFRHAALQVSKNIGRWLKIVS